MRVDYPRAGRAGWRRYVPSGRQAGAVAGLATALLLLLFGYAYATTDLGRLNDVAVGQATVIRYSDGSEIGRVGALNRISVPLSKVPVSVQHAVLAAEDRGFYSEPGISPTGIARALVNNVTGGDTQGGSTITQQYAKNAYLSQRRTYGRKLRELVIAVKLDRSESKDEILEGYLNTIYFGRGAYGIQTASQAYFGVDVSRLDVARAAVLAAIIRSPGDYDPALHPDRAQGRWQYVLDGMEKKGWLNPADRQRLHFPTRFAARNRGRNSLAGPKGYILQAVQDELAAKGVSAAQLAAGLDVRTTLSSRIQRAAEQAVGEVLPTSPKDVHLGITSITPGTGAVVALYGGRDYVTRAFDDATQAQRQPGSAFKPFVLATALQHGIGLRSRYDGTSPQEFPGAPGPVRNFRDEQCPQCDLLKATADSVNTVYYRLGLDAGGPPAVAGTAKAAGITSPIDPGRSGGNVFLGSGATVTTNALQMADAYATFAAGGQHAAPYLVQSARDSSGQSVYSAGRPKRDRALPADVVADATYAMQGVVARGTGRAAALPGRPAAGKTGTLQGNTDAWFCGFVPQLATAVHLYRDGADRPLRGIGGFGEVTGGTVPARLWQALMSAALDGVTVQPFPPPAFVGEPRNPAPPPPPSPEPSAPPSPTSTPVPTPSPTPSRTASPSPRPTRPRPTPSPVVTLTAPPLLSPAPTPSP